MYNINKCSICDQRVLNFVSENVKSIQDFDMLDITVIDEYLIKKNKELICNKLDESYENNYYKKLSSYFFEWYRFTEEYLNILFLHDINNGHNLTFEQHKKLDLLYLKILYMLIDLKVCLGLELNEISKKDINSYCMAIMNDIICGCYKPLNIVKHIDEKKLILTNYNLGNI